MAEGGFEDYEMEDFGRKYPEYDNMNEQELNDEHNRLINSHFNLLKYDIQPEHPSLVENNERINYIDSTLENRFGSRAVETTFTNNKDGKTVTIQRKGEPSTSVLVPKVDILDELLKRPVIEDFVRKQYKYKNFILDPRKK